LSGTGRETNDQVRHGANDLGLLAVHGRQIEPCAEVIWMTVSDLKMKETGESFCNMMYVKGEK
jgi:hypothetical protein